MSVALDRKLRCLEHTCTYLCMPSRDIHYGMGERISVSWWERLTAVFSSEDLV